MEVQLLIDGESNMLQHKIGLSMYVGHTNNLLADANISASKDQPRCHTWPMLMLTFVLFTVFSSSASSAS